MTKIIKTLFAIGALLVGAGSAYAYDYGVELKWNTDDIAQVLKTMPEQRASFKKLVDNGKIKDMFVENSQVGGQKTQLLKFVMEAESEQSVRDQLASLPLYQQDLVRINHIQLLGSKWLDNTPQANNFGLTFIWKSGIDPLEIDRVLGIDLQRVIALNQVGTVTSSYINTQNLENGVVRPTYLVAVLAKDAAHALEMSKQFEAVTMGYADVQVEPLGHKLDMSKL